MARSKAEATWAGRELLQASLDGGDVTYTHPNGINWGQAWYHYQHGNATPLSTPLSTIDLSKIHASDFPFGGYQSETFNLLGSSFSNLSDGLTYGRLQLSLSLDRQSLFSTLGYEIYDFNIVPWNGHFWRNIATIIGGAINSPGRPGLPFPIFLYGTSPTKP